MSRNEMFLLLACAFVAAIMSGAPLSPAHQPALTMASMWSPTQDDVPWNATTVVEHGFDRQ